MVKEPPSKEEVDRQRTRLLKNIELSLTNSEQIGLTLSESAASGDWRLLFTERDDLKKVTPEDVARVAQLYLKTSNRTLGRFIPTATRSGSRGRPPAPPDGDAQELHGRAAVEQGEAFDPTPANIESRIQRVTLPNGLKLVMLPKKTRGGHGDGVAGAALWR